MNAIPLDQVSVASPCDVSWHAMTGDDHVRFCGQCKQHVYNLSEMTAEAAAALIETREGQMCVRFYKRADGRMMTKDCPAAWRAIKRRFALVGAAAAAVVVAVFSLGNFTGNFTGGVRGKGHGGIPFVNPLARLHDWLFPPRPVPAPPPPPEMIMGKICIPDPVPPVVAPPPNLPIEPGA